MLGGADAGNYNLVSDTASTTADITRLNSVTWIGGATGNWFDPANWAGGAVPDLSNVANVIIPTGTVVTFDTSGAVGLADASGAVNIDSLGTLGSLTMADGTLNVSNAMTLDTFTQNGGTLTAGNITLDTFAQTAGSTATTGDFTVNDGFSQGTLGSVSVGGDTSITDTTGGVVIGNLNTTGTTSITSNDGDITQANGTTIVSGGTVTLDAGTNDIVLDSTTNDFQSTVNATGRNITLNDINAIELGDITASGTLGVSAEDDITQTNGTTISVIGETTLSSTSGDITLTGDNDFQGTVNTSGNDITLADTNDLELGDITASGTLGVSAVDDITQSPTSVIIASGETTLASTSGDITLTGDNDFQSTVNASGRNIAITDVNELEIVLHASGNSTLNAGGNLVVSGTTNDLTTTTTNGGTTTFGDETTTIHGILNTTSDNDINQTAPMSVDGNATLNAGTNDIALNDPNNRFSSAVNAIGANVNIRNLNDRQNDNSIENIITPIANNIIIPRSPIAIVQPITVRDNSNPIRIISQPRLNSNTRMISMTELRNEQTPEMLNQDTDIRVPVGEGSAIELVNGGVRLPIGVDQLLFVINEEN